MSDKKTNIIDTLQLNKPRGIVPPMKNVVGSTYAETRSELEARERATAEAEAALLAAREAANGPAKKSSVWFAILSVLFLIIALAGTGFGFYEYTKNISLEENYNRLEKDYIELKDSADETRRLYDDLVAETLINGSGNNENKINEQDTSNSQTVEKPSAE